MFNILNLNISISRLSTFEIIKRLKLGKSFNWESRSSGYPLSQRAVVFKRYDARHRWARFFELEIFRIEIKLLSHYDYRFINSMLFSYSSQLHPSPSPLPDLLSIQPAHSPSFSQYSPELFIFFRISKPLLNSLFTLLSTSTFTVRDEIRSASNLELARRSNPRWAPRKLPRGARKSKHSSFEFRMMKVAGVFGVATCRWDQRECIQYLRTYEMSKFPLPSSDFHLLSNWHFMLSFLQLWAYINLNVLEVSVLQLFFRQ